MTQNFNPYAPPSSALEGSPIGSVWREDNVVILARDAILPCRCVKCNGPVDKPLKNRKIYWHHPAIHLVILLNIIIYAIVALIVQKSATISPGLCKAHKTSRNFAIAGGWVGSIAGISLGIAGLASDGCGIAALGGILFLSSLIASFMLARIVYPTKIDDNYIRLKEAGKAFLDSLPEFHA